MFIFYIFVNALQKMNVLLTDYVKIVLFHMKHFYTVDTIKNVPHGTV